MKKTDLTGQRFGRLTVMSEITAQGKSHSTKWLCLCDCGNYTEVYATNLKRGLTSSCKCLHKEITSKTNGTHHETKTRLFHIWMNMKARCLNQNCKSWKNYGGRGITICDEWKNSFVAFRDWARSSGYKNDLSIDRINVDGNYEPTNCRWATSKEQARNTRANVFYKGRCLSDWAEEVGISHKTINRRINVFNWPIEKAIFTPVKAKRI